MAVTAGAGIPYDLRETAAQGRHVQGNDSSNLLGNLESQDGVIGPTEMEINVQLPTCSMQTKSKDKSSRLHCDTTYTNIQVHHWIKVCWFFISILPHCLSIWLHAVKVL